MHLSIDILGWSGALLLLIAFALVSNDRLKATGLRYQCLNIIGSLLLLTNNVFYGAYPSGFVNLVWAGVAGVTFVRRIREEART